MQGKSGLPSACESPGLEKLWNIITLSKPPSLRLLVCSRCEKSQGIEWLHAATLTDIMTTRYRVECRYIMVPVQAGIADTE